MAWIPFVVSSIFFLAILFFWSNQAFQIRQSRKKISHRILVVGSRGKSGTVRLVSALLSNTGMPTYAKITGTVAEEIDVQGTVKTTRRIGLVSSVEMGDVLIRARRDGALAVVLECMAVLPKLIGFVQNSIVQAPILIIPTIRLDHLEDEGDTLAGITRGILDGMKHVKVLITGESNEEPLAVMRSWAAKNKVRLIHVQNNTTTPVIAGHHPTNIETAIAVADELGIDKGTAIDAMMSATHEPDAETSWVINAHDKNIFFSDLGGANDPQSSAEAILRAHTISPDSTVIPILVNRWDRPLRTIAFAYSLRANPDTPAVGIIGPAIPQVRRALRTQGFSRQQIHHISWRSTLTKKRSLHKLQQLAGERKNVWFAVVENIHAFPADRIRSAIHFFGKPIHSSSTPTSEDRHA